VGKKTINVLVRFGVGEIEIREEFAFKAKTREKKLESSKRRLAKIDSGAGGMGGSTRGGLTVSGRSHVRQRGDKVDLVWGKNTPAKRLRITELANCLKRREKGFELRDGEGDAHNPAGSSGNENHRSLNSGLERGGICIGAQSALRPQQPQGLGGAKGR